MANKKNTNKKETETAKKKTAGEKNALKETTSSKQTSKKNTTKKSETAKEGKEKNTVVKKASEGKKSSNKTKSSNSKKNVDAKAKTKKVEKVTKEEDKEAVITEEKPKKEEVNKKSKGNKKETTKKEEKVEKKNAVKATDTKSVKANSSSKKESKITVPTVDSEHRIKKIIIIIVSCILFLALAYLLTVFIIDNRDNESTENPSEAIIQYDSIMIGSSLVQNDNNYYVLISSDEDPNAATYSSYMQTYAQKENALKIYTADYKEGFNKKYIAETSNLLVSNINDLKITGSTLLKISNKAVVEAYEGNQILSAFSNLIK